MSDTLLNAYHNLLLRRIPHDLKDLRQKQQQHMVTMLGNAKRQLQGLDHPKATLHFCSILSILWPTQSLGTSF